MQILDYIVKEVYILIPVLYIIGMFLKKIPNLKDWMIPWILLGLGMLGGFFLAEMSIHGIIQGILASGASVFANQLYKQTKEKVDEYRDAINNSKDDDDSGGARG